jgi:hypothetical protein
VVGPYPKGYRAIRWVSGLVFQAFLKDQTVNRRLSRVTTMLAHPASLTTPGFLLRALTAGARG